MGDKGLGVARGRADGQCGAPQVAGWGGDFHLPQPKANIGSCRRRRQKVGVERDGQRSKGGIHDRQD